ncbi:hypothetical protein GCM10027169_25660 [Gordonia jinhuaensis]|uniref:histidine kinase n=1 Tax=Gordonia jinhuaensis TaxID=1517702 RepID=A0A916TCA9_9ACTN|nr:ATP-binding protein [Gordonia jinhuaensis]GGB39030.1 hypothetical protein GCM10011489_28450 [Gordonia jinhuaensis]
MLTRALRNLTDNAARHTRSTIWLTMTTDEDHAVITVDDNGAGIPADQRERVFDRFARLDSDRRDVTGTGLGLAIAREIARAHRGDVRVGEGGPGARVELVVPLAIGTAPPHTSRSRYPAPQTVSIDTTPNGASMRLRR